MNLMDQSKNPKNISFHQVEWNSALAEHVAKEAARWFIEDLGYESDWTSVGLVSASAACTLDVVVRNEGVIAGLEAARVVIDVSEFDVEWHPEVSDGMPVSDGTVVARIAGLTRSVLATERVILNLLGRMSGVASATKRLVDAVDGTTCQIFDTRKTIPGWRLLDKLAVRLGGGWNHRLGLYDAILIKDNHLAALANTGKGPGDAVRQAKSFIAQAFSPERADNMVVEVELDELDSLTEVLQAGANIVLLDNMTPAMMAEAVAMRDGSPHKAILEASGGVRPETAGAIARTGVDRISSGWPTHHAPWIDVGLDWKN